MTTISTCLSFIRRTLRLNDSCSWSSLAHTQQFASLDDWYIGGVAMSERSIRLGLLIRSAYSSPGPLVFHCSLSIVAQCSQLPIRSFLRLFLHPLKMSSYRGSSLSEILKPDFVALSTANTPLIIRRFMHQRHCPARAMRQWARLRQGSCGGTGNIHPN